MNGSNTMHLAVGAGKDGNLYVVNRDNMGKFNPNNNTAIYQELAGALPGGVWAMPAYFNGTLYYGASGDKLRALPIVSAQVAATASSKEPFAFGCCFPRCSAM